MTDHSDAASSTAAASKHPDATVALSRLQRLIRARFAAAVVNDGLDPGLANDLLQAFDLRCLPRHWRVRLSLTFTAGVTACHAEDAYDAAANAIEQALTHASIPVDIEWDDREPHEAVAGDIDHDELAACQVPTVATAPGKEGATDPQNNP